MSLLSDWKNPYSDIKKKSIWQLISVAGDGKLLDGSDCAGEFRELLSNVTTVALKEYADQCLTDKFENSGLALQDIVNEVGSRLGLKITRGRYRGTKADIGFDGMWKYQNGHALVVEVKTTDAYRVNLYKIAEYRSELIDQKIISKNDSSVLIVVGRFDTGNLEAEIRGSRYAWDMRIISVDGLFRLLHIMEELDDPHVIKQIHNILIPREFTRLDEITDILFSTKEDIKQPEIEVDDVIETKKGGKKEPKITPVAFHEACIERIQTKLDLTLIKRSRSFYSTPTDEVGVNVSVSKQHLLGKYKNFWFAFHPHQKEKLEELETAYVAFGCESPERIFMIPFVVFNTWLDSLWITEKEDKMYWHVRITVRDGGFKLNTKKGVKEIEVSEYLI
jgi:hypothetical protein